MFNLDIAKMGYTILYKNNGSFFCNQIEKEQIKIGIPKEAACFTHVEISGGGQWAVNIAPPKIKISDIQKVHKGREIRICRFMNQDFEDRKRYKVAFWASSLCNRGYDFAGIARFKVFFMIQIEWKYFCSEGWLWAHRQEFPNIMPNKIPADCMPGHIAAFTDMETIWEGLI